MDKWQLRYLACALNCSYPILKTLSWALHQDSLYVERVRARLCSLGFHSTAARRGWRGGQVMALERLDQLQVYEFRPGIVDRQTFVQRQICDISQLVFNCAEGEFLYNGSAYTDPVRMIDEFTIKEATIAIDGCWYPFRP